MTSRLPCHDAIRRALLLSTLTLAFTAAACGGAEPAPAKSAPSRTTHESDADGAKDEETSEPRTIEEAQERIARARASLEGPSAKKLDFAAEPAPTSPQGGASEPSRREERLAETCGSPCRALASMKRAVEALCRMTGESDNRCVDAKRTLSDSATRVSSCRCEGR